MQRTLRDKHIGADTVQPYAYSIHERATQQSGTCKEDLQAAQIVLRRR